MKKTSTFLLLSVIMLFTLFSIFSCDDGVHIPETDFTFYAEDITVSNNIVYISGKTFDNVTGYRPCYVTLEEGGISHAHIGFS